MPSTAGATKTIVVADDTAFVRDRFKSALEQAGHRVVTVKSAAELLARVKSDTDELNQTHGSSAVIRKTMYGS